MGIINANRNTGMASRQAIFGIVAALTLSSMLAIQSCRDDGNLVPAPEQKAKDPGIHKTYERGPATLTIDIDRSEITIADRLNMAISITVDDDYESELPRFGEKLEQFGIIDYHTTHPELTDENRRIVSRSYVLEPFLSGDYTIPPMVAHFWKNGEKEANRHEVQTEELQIRVASLLSESITDMVMHDIVPPISLPRTYSKWMLSGVSAGVIAVAMVAGILIYRKRKAGRHATERRIPAHERAYDALAALTEQGLMEKGEIKRFYRQISDILRHYIEDRFGLTAPEQTTEEFLISLKESKGVIREYNSLLKTFLSGCDLVKFAEHQPATEDIQVMFDSCKAFISGTQEEETKA